LRNSKPSSFLPAVVRLHDTKQVAAAKHEMCSNLVSLVHLRFASKILPLARDGDGFEEVMYQFRRILRRASIEALMQTGNVNDL
jgi:hypothetical protein